MIKTFADKQALFRKKRNTLIKCIKADEDNDVQHSSHNEYLFYHHSELKTSKYMIFTMEELKEFLFSKIKKQHEEHSFSFQLLAKLVGQTVDEVESFFLPNILLGDKNIYGGKYTHKDNSISNIYYVEGILAITLIDGKMELDDFLMNYVQHNIDEESCYNIFSYWNMNCVNNFYLFLMED